MLASSRSLGIGAGWSRAICSGLNVVYSSASDAKSFCICFCYRMVLTEFIPGPPLPLGMVSIRYSKYLCFHCSFSVTVPGGCHSQGCHEYPFNSARMDLWACLFLMSLKGHSSAHCKTLSNGQQLKQTQTKIT